MHMKIKQLFKTTYENKKGFTLLFAVLVSTLVVAIGATVVSIALRQTILSGTSRESQYAFYAANTALECAFYWDVRGVEGMDGAVFPISGDLVISDTSLVTCAGGEIMTGNGFDTNTDFLSGFTTYSNGDGTYTIKLVIEDQSSPPLSGSNYEYCAEATVSKTLDGATGIITTEIEAKGYNTCDLSSPRAVERGLLQSYES